MADPKVAVVTGGTRGIGLAIAHRLAAEGFDLMVSYRGDEEKANEAAKSLGETERQIEIFASDVTDADQAGALIERTMAKFGRIDALINNAGITRDTLMMRMSEDDWDAVLTTNLKGAFLCSKAAMRPMLRQRSGRIVNITSVVGLVGNAGSGELRVRQSRSDRPDQVNGEGSRLARDHGQRGRSRFHRDPPDRCTPGRSQGDAAQANAARAIRISLRTSPEQSPSSFRTAHPLSPVMS